MKGDEKTDTKTCRFGFEGELTGTKHGKTFRQREGSVVFLVAIVAGQSILFTSALV